MSYIKPDDNRLTGLTCSDAMRIVTAAAGGILEDELHFTSDSKRVFYENLHVGAVVHGTPDDPIADEDAMLALNTTATRKVHRGDFCIRGDTPFAIWLCIAGRGTTLAQWKKIGISPDGDLPNGHYQVVTCYNGGSPEVVFSLTGEIAESFVIP